MQTKKKSGKMSNKTTVSLDGPEHPNWKLKYKTFLFLFFLD